MALACATKFGSFEILSVLGAGGMGEVYRARDAVLGRDVAIKVLPSAFSEDADRLWRFKQEAQAAAALNHPNILTIYHVGEYQGAPYIVSELLEGQTLRQRLLAGPLPVRKAIECAVQVARGLATQTAVLGTEVAAASHQGVGSLSQCGSGAVDYTARSSAQYLISTDTVVRA